MAMNCFPALFGANRLLSAFKEILFEDIGFESTSGLAGDDEQRLRNVDLVLERFHLRRIGRIEHMQVRKLRNPAKSHPQNFGTKARTAHPQKENVLKTAEMNFLREFLQFVLMRGLLFNNVEPAEPLRFVVAGPEARVAIPQSLHLPARLPVGNRRLYRCSQRFGQGSLQSAHGLILSTCSSQPPPEACQRRRQTT